MSNMPSLLFGLHCIVVLVAALVGITTSRGPQTRVACFLVSMSSLVGILILLDAHAIAIAQLFFCIGTGLVTFYVIGVVSDAGEVEASDQSEERAASESDPPSWQWLIIMLGLAIAISIGSLLIDVLPTRGSAASHGLQMSEQSIEAVGLALVIDQGIALVGVGLLLLACMIGAGFLARRGVD